VRTPSAALRVGGLAESIVDEQTGILAETARGAGAPRSAALVADRPTATSSARRAHAAPRGFTWQHTAEQNLAVLERAADDGRPARSSMFAGLRGSATIKAAAMAVATLAANALAIVFTVVFTRLLGVGDYGALGALLSTFTILAVAGTALQVAVARETALGHLGGPGAVGAAIRRYLTQLAVAGVAITGASFVLREEIAELIAVPEHALAAAAILPTGVLWLVLSVLRGALQGLHATRPWARASCSRRSGAWSSASCSSGRRGVTGAFLARRWR
jgi:hypothetical protein